MKIEAIVNVLDTEIPLAPMGVLANGSAHAWPPIDTSGVFLRTCLRGEGK